MTGPGVHPDVLYITSLVYDKVNEKMMNRKLVEYLNTDKASQSWIGGLGEGGGFHIAFTLNSL